MNYINKALEILELNKVLNMLSNEAVSEPAKKLCKELAPTDNVEMVNKLIDETSSACNLMSVKGSPSFSSICDIKPYIERASLGGSLNTLELLAVNSVLRSSRIVKNYICDDKLNKSSIDFYFNALHTNKYLEDKISSCIIAEDEISDNASAELSDIRRKIRNASSKARESLQRIISSPSYAKALQENIITMRSGRYVVPVKAEHKNDIPGLVHDTSSSGATLFIEPMAAVKANNELRELNSKEKIEIERILHELSYECAGFGDDIISDYNLLVKLDFIFAKAKFSYNNECSPAIISRSINLIKARHPLLSRDIVVPVSVNLGNEFDTLIITGPNTGGKTVTLKTIGLLCAMNQCGLHIPAKEESTLPVFDKILCDIGDEQSIEQSLSTFSAHMKNIVDIIKLCDSKSLVLFDEIGAGTDPVEGAALAVSIIEYVRKKGAAVAATTHYTELKVYATNEPGVQNASCEFDVETLKPTYKLLIGIPGKSNAFSISKKLGLNDDIIEDARKRINVSNTVLETTIERLDQTRKQLESNIAETELKLNQAREKEKRASQLKAEHEIRLEKAEIKAKREAEEILNDARQTAESVFAELDEMKKRINEEDDVNRINEARNELRKKLNLAENKFINKKLPDSRISSRKIDVNDYVEIKSIGMKGKVEDIASDGTLHITSGNIRLNAKENEVYLLEDYKPKTENKKTASICLHESSVSSQLDIRGMDSLEGTMTAENFIDSAVMNRLETISIIHGKGTGALRASIHKMLKTNKNVKNFRIGNFGEGESGVTIVNLK